MGTRCVVVKQKQEEKKGNGKHSEKKPERSKGGKSKELGGGNTLGGTSAKSKLVPDQPPSRSPSGTANHPSHGGSGARPKDRDRATAEHKASKSKKNSPTEVHGQSRQTSEGKPSRDAVDDNNRHALGTNVDDDESGGSHPDASTKDGVRRKRGGSANELMSDAQENANNGDNVKSQPRRDAGSANITPVHESYRLRNADNDNGNQKGEPTTVIAPSNRHDGRDNSQTYAEDEKQIEHTNERMDCEHTDSALSTGLEADRMRTSSVIHQSDTVTGRSEEAMEDDDNSMEDKNDGKPAENGRTDTVGLDESRKYVGSIRVDVENDVGKVAQDKRVVKETNL